VYALASTAKPRPERKLGEKLPLTRSKVSRRRVK